MEEESATSVTTCWSKKVKILDTICCAHHWNVGNVVEEEEGGNNNNNESTTTTKKTPESKGLVVLYHGFLAHGKYPTVKYAAEFLAIEGNYSVVSIDFPGHGQSDGDRGYLPSSQMVVDYGIAMLQYAKTLVKTNKIFLVGSSMGGAIALLVAQKQKQLLIMQQQQQNDTKNNNNNNDKVVNDDDDDITGVVLLAPMLKLNVNGLEHTLLTGLSYVVGSLALIPSSATDDTKQYRDETKRMECSDDPLTIGGSRLKVASALTCVDITLDLHELFDTITSRMLICVADEDVVVQNEGSKELYDKSPSNDKTFKNYPALHGLLCEPKPLFDIIKKDILDWMSERS